MTIVSRCAFVILAVLIQPVTGQTRTDFESDVAPILLSRCLECHQAVNPSGGLSLQTENSQRQGGDSGPALVPGDAAGSLMIMRITAAEMPPPANGHERPLPAAELAVLRRWIDEGANVPPGRILDLFEKTLTSRGGRDWWSLQPLQTPQPPAPSTVPWTSWQQHPVDRFLAASLQRQQLTPAPRATARELVRRLSWVLTGLPPRKTDVDLAVAAEKTTQGALTTAQYEQLTDRLLASPQYGERWARHWLDVVRYADTSGYERDQPKPFAWKYRDWVVQALNADMPWGQFVRLQLAGDEVPDRSEHTVIATGFLRLGTWNDEPNDPEDYVYERLEDLVHTTASAFLGLTVKCARCHDHKFDPIPQTDYYALAGIFSSTETLYGGFRSQRNRQPSGLIALPINDQQETAQAIASKELQQLKQQVDELEQQLVEARRQQRLGVSPSPNQNPSKASGNRADPRRAFLNAAVIEQQIVAIKAKISSVDETGKPISLCMGVQDRSQINNARLLVRGEIDKAAQEVPRGFVALLDPSNTQLPSGASGRLELAKWLTSKDNPLTARVMANRVWQHLTGRPLVTEPDNFGMSGPGTKQQLLLDYLSIYFMENGWSVKQLVRHIATSHTYRLSSEVDEELFEKDPDNELLARANRRRLDAEAIRDSMLMASGQIDLKRPNGSLISQMGFAVVGPNGPVAPVMAAGNMMSANSGNTQAERMRLAARMMAAGRSNPFESPAYYRSVYLPIARGLLPRSLAVFDFAEPSMVVPIREVSSTAEQALFMLNNDFVMQQGEAIARRLLTAEAKPAERVKELFMITLGRQPSADELQSSIGFVNDASEMIKGSSRAERQFAGWSQLCQAMLATAEFRWVD